MEMRGNELSQGVQRDALRRFVHRYTGDHKPQWVSKDQALHFASDADWLANTTFHVTSKGKLDNRHKSCYSRPTWPNNPELRK